MASLVSLFGRYSVVFAGLSGAALSPLSFVAFSKGDSEIGGDSKVQDNTLEERERDPFLSEGAQVSSKALKEEPIRVDNLESSPLENQVSQEGKGEVARPESFTESKAKTFRSLPKVKVERSEFIKKLLAKPTTHQVDSSLGKTITYSEFKKIWGSDGFKDESPEKGKFTENPNGWEEEKRRSIIDAWESFFLNKTNNKAWYENFDIPFLSKDLPFIVVELPKDYEDVPEDWIEIDNDTDLSQLPNRLFFRGNNSSKRKFQTLLGNQEKYAKYLSQKDNNQEELKEFEDRVISSKKYSRLFLVNSPKLALRRWLKDWNSKYENESLDKDSLFSPFESILYSNKTFNSSSLFSEANILKRVYKGQEYRFMIFSSSMPTKTIQVCAWPSKSCSYVDNVTWSDNFLLSLMSWYVYSRKPSWTREKVVNSWNLIAIYRDWNYYYMKPENFSEEVYYQHLPLFIRAWFNGEGKYGWSYYWTYHKNITERHKYVRFVGEAIKERSSNWGNVKNKKS